MPDTLEEILESGVVLKNFDTSQRCLIRPVNGGNDSGNTAIFIGLIGYFKINTAGLAAAFNGLQIDAFFAAQWIKKYVVAVFSKKIRFLIAGNNFGRSVHRNNFAIRRQNHYADRQVIKNIAQLTVFYEKVAHWKGKI